MMWGWGTGWSWVGMTMMLVFWIGVAALVVWTVRTLAGSRQERRDDPEQILRERYARGQIDEDEFNRRLEHLRG